MEDNNKNNKTSAFWEFVKYALIALLIVIPFRIFIAQPYMVSGLSMYPTFKNGDYLIVDQLSKRFGESERGAVIIIRYPKNPSTFFIKRLIAFPNEEVKIENGVIKIFNDQNPNGFRINDSYVKHRKDEDFFIKLEKNEYFVMGDNRVSSSDSRIWGPLPRENIVGEPILRLWPIKKITLWPGVFND